MNAEVSITPVVLLFYTTRSSVSRLVWCTFLILATQPFQAQKQDLIAELKMSKDIVGIKKLKVERVKLEEKHEKEMVTEITRQFSLDNFVEKVGEF